MAQEEFRWLVKSSGRVLGPYPANQIIDLLRTREISVLDEVSEPLRRWQTLQYHEAFKAAIDALRKSNLSEKTEATWTPSTITGNLTQTVTDLVDGDLTEELTGDLDGFTGTPREIVIHDLPEQGRPAQASGGGRFQPQQTQNTAIQRKVEKTARGLWVATIAILVLVGVFILQKRGARNGPSADRGVTINNLKQTVVKDVRMGEFGEALKELKTFYPDPNQSGEMAIYYGPLLIQLEGQTVVGRRLLNALVAANTPDLKEVYTALGIADLIDGQVDSAGSYFEKALAIDPSYIEAMLNSAAVAVQKGEYARAKSLAYRALKLNPAQGEALLTLAEAQLYLFKGNHSARELNQVDRVVRDYLAKNWNYVSELGFYSLYFDRLRQDHGIESRIRQYLDRDPDLTDDHVHNMFIYRGHSQWRVLARLCEQMTEKMNDDAWVSTLLSSCYAHEERWDLSRRSIEKAVQQQPKDALIQAWYSYVLKGSGEAAQASFVLGNASQLNRRGEYTLPTLLQARFCQSKDDVACAHDSWQALYERDIQNLQAVAGSAWVAYRKGAKSEASNLIKQGLKISPDYIPLLKLQQKGLDEGWYAGG